MLPNRGFDREGKDKMGPGRIGLHWAASGGYEAVVRLNKETNVDAANGKGWTVLHVVAKKGQEAVA